MGFNEFFKTYIVADWILHIFLTISPTLIAILTIWLNNKREREKEIKNRNSKAVNDIQESVLRLNSMIWNTGKELLDSIQHADEAEKSDFYYERFYENNKNMLVEARSINGKADIYIAMTGILEFAFTELFQKIPNISEGFISILDDYNKKSERTPITELDKLLDEVQKKLIDLTYDYEYDLVMYCVMLNETLKRTTNY